MPKNHKQLLGVTKSTSREDAQDLKFNIYHATYYCIQENLSKNWEIQPKIDRQRDRDRQTVSETERVRERETQT